MRRIPILALIALTGLFGCAKDDSRGGEAADTTSVVPTVEAPTAVPSTTDSAGAPTMGEVDSTSVDSAYVPPPASLPERELRLPPVPPSDRLPTRPPSPRSAGAGRSDRLPTRPPAPPHPPAPRPRL